jgi:hypothetical protein
VLIPVAGDDLLTQEYPVLACSARAEDNHLGMPAITTNNHASIPKTAALLAVARRLIWWMPPEEALGFPDRFLAQVMTLGTWDDVQCVRAEVGEERLRQALLDAPPGVFDRRSWHYWHHVFGIEPMPDLPRRKLP